MKNSIFTVLAALVLYPAGAQPVTPQDRRRAAELVERMTLDEKIGQLVQQRGGGAVTGPDKTELSVERLVREGRCGSVFNIKSFEETERLQRIGADVIHGFRTIFPINLAVAASWDPAAAESLARVSAREALAMGIHWTFSPMCDVSRDPRWGRVSEGAGEDPYLGARVAEAMVRGYQGDLSDPSSVLACVKHFAAYGAPQAGREYHAVDMSERVFRDSYLPPYRAALDAGAATVMTSFNDLDGVPATANRWLMRDLLRDELGFGGFVVTDYGTIGELKAHGVAGDDAQAAELALRAGVNMDMMSAAYLFHAAELVREGRIPESLIDSLCCEVLAVKFRLGLFDDPFRYQAKEREKCYYAPEHLDAARRVSGNGFYYLMGDIARLHEAVLAYARDFMIDKGFTYCIPPFMIHGNVVEGVMSQTDMDAMMYKIEGEDLYLIGTSEHSMIGRYIDQILTEDQLPQTMTSYSPCFRKEKGAHGIEERGVYRIHQFEKQEMIVVCRPEESMDWYEKLWRYSVATSPT